MNQKGFIPIIFIIIGAVVLASATFGVVKYKDEITANVSKVFKSKKVEIPNIDSTGKDEVTEEPELVEEPIIEEPEAPPELEIKERLKELSQTIKPELNKEEQNEPEETTPEVQPEPQNQEATQEPKISEDESEEKRDIFKDLFKKDGSEEEKEEELVENYNEAIVSIVEEGQRFIIQTYIRLLGEDIELLIDDALSKIPSIKSFADMLYTTESYGLSDEYYQAINNFLKASEGLLISYRNFWNAYKEEIINLVLSYSTPVIEKSSEFEAVATSINKDFTELRKGIDEDANKDKAEIEETNNELVETRKDLHNIANQKLKEYTESILNEEEQRYQQFLERTTPKPNEIDLEAQAVRERQRLMHEKACEFNAAYCRDFNPPYPY